MIQALSEIVMTTRTAIRLHCVIITLMAALLSGCGPSAAEQERMSQIAKVKKIAVVAIVGKSSVSPKAKICEQFMDEILADFQNAAKTTPPVVEFVPIQHVVGRKVGNTLLVRGEEFHGHKSDPPESTTDRPSGRAE